MNVDGTAAAVISALQVFARDNLVKLRRLRHTDNGTAGIFRLVSPVWLGLALVAVAAIVCLAVGGPVARAAEPPTETSLAVEPLAPIDLGKTTTVTARLTTSSGNPILGETVGLAVDGVHRFRAATDQNGNVSFTVPGDLDAGTHDLVVGFDGTGNLAPATAQLNLVINPATIEIQTVPALAGIEFSLDGHPFASGSDGVARYTVTRIGGLYRLELVTASTNATNARYTFSRWGDPVFVPSRQVSVQLGTRFRIGFNVSYLTNLTFVDTANQPVAPGRITSLKIKSPHQQVFNFDRVQPEWLPATTVIQDGNGLKSTAITYTVAEVTVDGVTVVDRDQQHFELDAPSAPRISLKLYSVHFRGRDAIFGFPLGTGIYLQHPDGFVEYRPFESADEVTFTALPLATYRAGVIGGPGLSRTGLFDLTPGQTVPLSVISYFDMAAVVAVGGWLAILAFVLVGWLRRRARRPVPVDVVRPTWHRYAVRFGYLCLPAGLLALGFVLTDHQAPGIGDPSKAAAAASAAKVPITRAASPTAGPGRADTHSPPAQPEPVASSSAPAVVSPTFYAVWRRNGGQATFGNARGAEFEEVDPDTGQRLTVQYFDRARLEYHPTSAGTPYQVELGRLGAEEAKQRGLLDTEPFRPVPESAAQNTPDCEYFAETGHRLCGRFRDYWHSHGLKLGDANTTSARESDALLGYPISEEFTDPETGLITQYFERARLEYRPERAGTPDEVIAGNLDVGQP